MSDMETIQAFLLANDPVMISKEEFYEVKKSVKNMLTLLEKQDKTIDLLVEVINISRK